MALKRVSAIMLAEMYLETQLLRDRGVITSLAGPFARVFMRQPTESPGSASWGDSAQRIRLIWLGGNW